MSGINELEQKYYDRINAVLVGRPEYLRGYVSFMSDVAVRTRYNYVKIIIDFTEKTSNDISNLNFDDFNNYLAERYIGIGASYQIAIYSAVKKFCEYLYASKRIKDNYMLYIKKPKFKESQETVKKREIGFLNEKEMKKYIRNLDKKMSEYRDISDRWRVRDKAIVYVFLNTGMRCSALLSIDVKDIDMKNRTLHVTEKGGKIRTYDLSTDVYKVLKEWIDERSKIDNVETDALFISDHRKRMGQQNMYLLIKKYSAGIDGKNITPHKLRATYGTQLYNKTGDIYFVQDCMGHHSPKTTENYVREKKQNTKKASDIMSKLMK